MTRRKRDKLVLFLTAGLRSPTDIAFCGCRMRVQSVNRFYCMTVLGRERLQDRFEGRFAW